MRNKFLTGIMSLLVAGSMLTTSCSDDDNANINTKAIISSVETGDASVTAVSANITGTVKDLSSQSTSAYTAGVMLSTSADDVKSGTEIDATLNDDGTFSVEKTGLQKNVTYYYTTFVTLQDRISYYGETKSFVTTDAKVATTAATGVGINTGTIGGQLSNVSSLPSDATLSCGVFMSQSKDTESLEAGKDLETSDITSAQNGTAYTFTQKDLLPNTKYYYIAYMKLNDGYILGSVDSLSTGNFTPEFVDLGLSVQWAKTNIGATTEDEIGGLYGYGDPTGLKMTSNDTYPTEDVTGGTNDICMATSTGGRLPSVSEAKELVNKCTFKDSTVNSVAGYKVTGPNGNSIFIPKAGYRDGTTTYESGESAYLWTGSINANSTERGYTVNMKSGSDVFGSALSYQGLSIRAVKQTLISFTGSKLVTTANGDDCRLEIYNAWGSTADNSGIDISSFMFSKKMYVNFSVFGLGKLAKPITATIGFADGSWGVQDWATSTQITGDGNYTLEVQASTTAKGIKVFVIDLKGQKDLVDKIDAYINSIIVDTDNPEGYPTMNGEVINQSKLKLGDIEGNGNYRMEIYNTCGTGTSADPPFDASVLSFSKRLRVQFTISGLGTLSATKKASIIYADKNWGNSNWGECAGSCEVTGDGTYSTYIDVSSTTAAPPAVFTVDINGLSSVADLTKVKTVINDIVCK